MELAAAGQQDTWTFTASAGDRVLLSVLRTSGTLYCYIVVNAPDGSQEAAAYRHINQQVSHSLGQISLEANIPVLFGVLTCNNMEQAIHRSGGNVGNKGSECADAALEMVSLLRSLS